VPRFFSRQILSGWASIRQSQPDYRDNAIVGTTVYLRQAEADELLRSLRGCQIGKRPNGDGLAHGLRTGRGRIVAPSSASRAALAAELFGSVDKIAISAADAKREVSAPTGEEIPLPILHLPFAKEPLNSTADQCLRYRFLPFSAD